MAQHDHMTNAQIRAKIAERNAQGKPVGQLVESLRQRNNIKHAHLSTEELYAQVTEREAQGKPTGQLRRVLRDRGEDIDWQSPD